jgi:uncharacterized protein YecE (DUF72 family)
LNDLKAMECRDCMGKPPTNRLRLGCAGWTISKTAADRFATAGSHLSRFAQTFSAAEINSSFYRPHRPATYARWAKTVPEGFRFSVKMPKEVTHVRRLVDAAEPMQRFFGETGALGETLGPVLVQLPPSLAFEKALAQSFFEELRTQFDGSVACEPRHASWFTAESEQLLIDHRVTRVAADPAILPAAGMPGGFGELAYYRLHGSPRIYFSSYDATYLTQLAEQLLASQAAGAEVWCIFDNTALGAAALNALELREILERAKSGMK